MSIPNMLQFHAPEVGVTFRARLLIRQNPDVADQLLAQLPLQSTLGHVVISGQAIWLPTRIVHLGRNNMVKRHPGAVYLNSVGGSLCLTYGTVTESALVNKVAEVVEDDFEDLNRLGHLVYEKTVTSARHTLLTIHISLIDNPTRTLSEHQLLELSARLGACYDCNWRDAKELIEMEVDRVWITKPDEIKKISWGIIDSGAGSGEQYFSVMVHLKSFLLHLGCDVLYRLLKVSKYDEVLLPTLIRMTREFLEENFNTFEMLSDLGLDSMRHVGASYSKALPTLGNKEEYRQLTGVLFTYVCRMHRWVHFIFPWNIGVAFPHRKPDEIISMTTMINGLPSPISTPSAIDKSSCM
ncbi:hypothetical protein EYZ11_007732 [Aspergillus tanneri]|uniref:Cucumopine synthase C-terminal helical bundle domain-containing protein n=1 Tax=Aspergillus tanneri TaxID=1220188 RepID=A0A4S3JHT8_9EURO|nr:uncharacterized protein ATNIH1004_006746 [Aspergillus tanneri]KAA8645327.1 hypothetical protein ATNIH1004_006746 [Aspergillus tanneri]THC92771.1 hypothetical protein EYZ11_007732 [Aspergillus tanneri]